MNHICKLIPVFLICTNTALASTEFGPGPFQDDELGNGYPSGLTLTEKGVFQETSQLNIIVNLPATVNPGLTHPVDTCAVDSHGVSHALSVEFTQTKKPLEWAISVHCEDAVVGGITQVSGTNDGAIYSDVTFMFDSQGCLRGFQEDNSRTPPMLCIQWADSDTENSLISLDFGEFGSLQAIRAMGTKASTITNKHNGLPMRPYEPH